MVAREMDQMNETFKEALERPAELVKDYPVSSMLVVFGVGMGVGLLLCQAMCSTMFEPEPTLTDRWQRQLMGAADRVLPASMSRQLHQYAA
jgi:hypothetical protein